MLRIDQLRLHPGQQETLLRARCAKLLRVAPADITACTVLRKAIDAREDLTLVYTVSVSVKNEAQVLRRCSWYMPWPSRCGRRSRYCAAAAISAYLFINRKCTSCRRR